MNRFLILVLTVLIAFILPSCTKSNKSSSSSSQSPEQSSSSSSQSSATVPDSGTPQGSVKILVDNLKDWSSGTLSDYVREFSGKDYDFRSYETIISPLLNRIECKVGAAKIEGNNAAVEVEITAVDAKKAVNELALGLLAKAAISGNASGEGLTIEFVSQYIEENVDIKSLATTTTTATVYMTRDVGNSWKLDTSNVNNVTFVNAFSGGAVALMQDLQKFIGESTK